MKQSPDEEFRDEWKKFVKDFLPKKFDRFSHDDVRDGPGSYAALAIEAIQKGDPYILVDAINEDSLDYASSSEYQAYMEAKKEFSKEWENPEQVARDMENYSYFYEDFIEIYEDRENFNWDIYLRGMDILVWNKKDSVHAGWVGDPQDAATEIEENPDLKAWCTRVAPYISTQQIHNIINNGFDYDVELFIGGIYDVVDLIRSLMDDGVLPTVYHGRDVIVGAYDGLNGAGYFEHGSTSASLMTVLGDKKNPLHVDWGSYSLGDVFGTNEWTWR